MSYDITVYGANRGTPLTQGETSLAGHMWISITDNEGNTNSYGFQSANHKLWGKGKVVSTDITNYQRIDFMQSFKISEAQYNEVKNWADAAKNNGAFGDYNVLNNSCVDFAWKALTKAEVAYDPLRGIPGTVYLIDRGIPGTVYLIDSKPVPVTILLWHV